MYFLHDNKTVQLGAENLAHTSSRFSIVNFCLPQIILKNRVALSWMHLKIMDHLHWRRLLATHDCHDCNVPVLALVTLGSATKIEMILSLSHRPRWPRKVTSDWGLVKMYRVISVFFAISTDIRFPKKGLKSLKHVCKPSLG